MDIEVKVSHIPVVNLRYSKTMYRSYVKSLLKTIKRKTSKMYA